VERLIWTEAEPDEAERLVDDLDDLLAEQELSDGFGQDPLEAHIECIRKDLGLPGPAATDRSPPALGGNSQRNPSPGRPSAEPPDNGPDEDWRSSA
jgi:hypothetical protein